jgi:hypothetical protein
VLENVGDCPVDVVHMVLSFQTASTTGTDLEFELPEFRLGGGEVATVGNGTVSLAHSWDIETNKSIPIHASNGGYLLLCNGVCSAALNVVDAFAFKGSGTNAVVEPPALPAPVTFSPLSAVTPDRQDDDSYQRVQYTGSYPNFNASDWTARAAKFSECLGASQGASCTTRGVVCHGTTTCTCTDAIGAVYYGWSCK